MRERWRVIVATFWGAIAFYTCLPVPHTWQLNFHGIARWVPAVGLLIGGVLGLMDWALGLLGMPILVRSVAVVIIGVGITGGLHLDGAIDTADGLAVIDPQRRLAAMADSQTGAFGVMVAISILLLKVTALSSIEQSRWFVLMGVASWGRWGQLVAIARYPYLKAEGKGALHKAAIQSNWEALPTWIVLIGFSSLPLAIDLELAHRWQVSGLMALGGSLIAVATGAWFNRNLGGQTGDTYGAIVEWTEALLLFLLTIAI
jgi:adenosylcobinamide-GDP ribazoletransferase